MNFDRKAYTPREWEDFKKNAGLNEITILVRSKSRFDALNAVREALGRYKLEWWRENNDFLGVDCGNDEDEDEN